MNHQSTPPQPRSIPRALAGLGGLTACLTAAVGPAPHAWAAASPPAPSLAPVPPLPPPATAPAHFPPWVITTILAATVVLSIGTTLITLALERLCWARRQAAANPWASAQSRKPENMAQAADQPFSGQQDHGAS